MTSKLTKIMTQMIEQFPSEDKGVFVLSPDSMKEFRKSTGRFSGEFKGHKVRKVNQAPKEKIYLLTEEDYQELIKGLESPLTVIKKEENETTQKID